jgi:hypothetical protein
VTRRHRPARGKSKILADERLLRLSSRPALHRAPRVS